MYFKINSLVKILYDKLGACLYDTRNGDMIYLEQQYADALKRAESNNSLSKADILLLKELKNNGYGEFYDKPVFLERPRFGMGKMFDTDKGKAYLSELFIQISNDCNLNCLYCHKEGKVFRQTGCKCWNNGEANYNVETLNKIIIDAFNIGCQKISLIGGEPFLEIERVKQIIDFVKDTNMELNIYSNLTLLSENVVMVLKSYKNIKIITDILSIDQNIYEKITQSNFKTKQLINNILCLHKNNINCHLRLLISNLNEEYVEGTMAALKKVGLLINDIKLIYPTKKKDFSSKHYQSWLYNNSKPKAKISLESITLYEKYNSCLFGKIYLNLNGDWTPCPMMNDYKLGNIDKVGLGDILATKEYKDIIYLNRQKIHKCKTCSYSLNCFDCRALELSATGDIYGEYYCNRKI